MSNIVYTRVGGLLIKFFFAVTEKCFGFFLRYTFIVVCDKPGRAWASSWAGEQVNSCSATGDCPCAPFNQFASDKRTEYCFSLITISLSHATRLGLTLDMCPLLMADST